MTLFMRIRSNNSELSSAPRCQPSVADLEFAVDTFLETMNEAGSLMLLRWATRHKLDLLRKIILSFLIEASDSELKEMSRKSSLPTKSLPRKAISSSEIATLRAIEREHIARVISESPTLQEAASVLGVSSATLWRKRNRYGL
jgi:NtrC-family two-component system response regulator AlgB